MAHPVPAELVRLLEERRRSRGLWHYGELAELLQPHVEVRLERPYTPLVHWLGALARQDVESERPVCTSIVVAVGLERPGDGYYGFLEQLDYLEAGLTAEERRQFWADELNDLYEGEPLDPENYDTDESAISELPMKLQEAAVAAVERSNDTVELRIDRRYDLVRFENGPAQTTVVLRRRRVKVRRA